MSLTLVEQQVGKLPQLLVRTLPPVHLNQSDFDLLKAAGMTQALETAQHTQVSSSFYFLPNQEIEKSLLSLAEEIQRPQEDNGWRFTGFNKVITSRPDKIEIEFRTSPWVVTNLTWKEVPKQNYPHIPPTWVLELIRATQKNFEMMTIADLEIKQRTEYEERPQFSYPPDPLLLGWTNGRRYLIPGGIWLKDRIIADGM